jgi:hypothetical protein
VNKKIKHRNPIAKDVRTPKYRMRVELSQKLYNRKRLKRKNMIDEQS